MDAGVGQSGEGGSSSGATLVLGATAGRAGLGGRWGGCVAWGGGVAGRVCVVVARHRIWALTVTCCEFRKYPPVVGNSRNGLHPLT